MLLRLVVWVRIVCTSELSRALHSSDVSVWNSVWLPIQSIWAGMAKPWPCWNEQQPFRWFYWFYPIFFYCWKIIIMWIMERVNRWKIGHGDFFLLIYKLWFGENKKWKGERKKTSKCKCIKCRRRSIFQLCPCYVRLGCVWAATRHCPFLPQTELFLIKFTQALLLKFFIHFSQEKRNHSYLSKRVSDSSDIFHYKLLAPLLPTDRVTFLIPLLSSSKNGLFHY